MANFKRNIFAVKSRLQLKYALLLIFSMLIPSMFMGLCMYYFIFSIITEGLGIPEPIAYNLFPVLNKINLMMALGLPVIFIGFLIAGNYISYKLIGPINRLKKDLQQIAEGDISHRIKMREGDDLLFIAELVNKILDRKS